MGFRLLTLGFSQSLEPRVHSRFSVVATLDPVVLPRRRRVITRRSTLPPPGYWSPRFAAFHDEVMPPLLAAGALELLWLTVRGDPIAIIYNIVWNGKVYFYQSGRKIDVPKGVRPGIVIHAHAIRRAISAGRREYDFLGGASRYKVQLSTAARPLLRVRAVRSPRLELAHSTAERGFDTARRLRDQLRAQLGEP